MKNKIELANENATPKSSLGEPISLDLETRTVNSDQTRLLEGQSINCFSKEVYESNQKDCTNEAKKWVCGCNSVSYPNECEAKKAGVKSFKPGKCLKEAKDI